MTIKRIWYLFQMEFRFLSRRLILLVLVSAFVFFVFSLLVAWLYGMNVLPGDWYTMFHLGGDMFLFGFIWCLTSSFAFLELHQQDEGFYVLLPASSSEKFVSKLFGSVIVYPLLIFFVLFLCSLFSLLIIYYLTKIIMPVFLPFYGWVWSWYLFFFVLQSWFFWGSVTFSHNAFVKTALLLFGISFLISIVSTPVFQWLFGTVISWNGIVFYSRMGVVPEPQARLVFSLLRVAGEVLFYLSALLAYWLSYKRFVQYEVTHGV